MKRFITCESRNQIERPLGLIRWHHVPRIAHQNFRQIPSLFHVSCQIVIHMPLISLRGFIFGRSAEIEILQRVDRHRIRPYDVHLSVVDQDSVVVEQLFKPRHNRLHNIFEEVDLDFLIFDVESGVAHVNRRSHVVPLDVLPHVDQLAAGVHGVQIIEVDGKACYVLEERGMVVEVAG
jgi:hypothetical protein